MLRREYKLYKSVENRNALTVLYDREDYDIITTFMITEVKDFYPHIYKELEAVVTGQKEASDFGGNMLNMGIMEEF